MKRYFLSIFTAAFVISSCVQDIKVEAEEEIPEDEEIEVVVPEPQSLSISAGNATKSVLHEGSIKWMSGDQISVVFIHPENGASVSNDFVTEFEGGPSEKAIFNGTFDADVSSANGYNENAYAIYPHTAVNENGEFVFDLPSAQKAEEGGSFQSGCNLTSAPLQLSDVEDGSASADFLNALVNLRFKLDPAVKGVTFKGTAPFSGSHPMEVYFWDEEDGQERQSDHGRLLMKDGAAWTRESLTVSLEPEGEAESFSGEHQYNLIVWPGSHESLTITLDYGEPYGTFDLVNNFGGKGQTFEPNKFYTINFPSALDRIMSGIDKKIVVVENSLEDFENDFGDLEDDVDSLGMQIQSVSMLSDYTDNIVYARYSTFSSDLVRADIEANYLIRPASAAASLVERYNKTNDILKGQVFYKSESGFELGSVLSVSSAVLNGDVLTVTFDPAGLKSSVYNNGDIAEVALLIDDEATGTSILSDHAKILAKTGSSIRMNKSTDIPVLRNSTAKLNFDYFAASDDFTLEIVGNGMEGSYSGGSGGRGVVLAVNIPDADLKGKSVDIVLTCEGEKCVQTVTFVEGGNLEISTNGNLDHYGGEVTFSYKTSYSGVTPQITSGADWLTGQYPTYSAGVNSGNEKRTAEVSFTVTTSPGITCTRKYKVIQGSTSDDLVRTYRSDYTKLVLQEGKADVANKMNLVILGDGYQTKDMAVGGKFERQANSAMDSFFGIEPMSSLEDRFNVYACPITSEDEGISIDGGTTLNTVFRCTKGNGTLVTYKNGSPIDQAMSHLGLSDNNKKFRTIVIMLINTDEQIGTTSYSVTKDDNYTYGECCYSWAVAMVPANNSSVSGLIKHEAIGHGVGRLADEYDDNNPNEVTSYSGGNLSDLHSKGQYLNVTVTTGFWDDLINKGYSSEIGYVEGGLNCDTGIYKPTKGGMMYNNSGNFNAVCRRVIYERIIRQTEGKDAYSLDRFVKEDLDE